ncbi:MAG: hypothetical protein II928_00710 [Paludibacteraceae bacterium]|nr:hypothetical protein [Paludibacteraceae bacterium]
MEKQHENIVPTAGKEMNFWDLCVAICRAIGRGCVALWGVCARMIRLTYRYWWLVVTLVILAVAAACYHTRPKNIKYRVNATALINVASLQQFEQAFESLRTGKLLPPEAAINTYMRDKQAQRFDLFRVVDVHRDETPDYIDFKRKSTPKDTVAVQMHDRVCIQFVTPAYAVPMIPEIEKAILDVLNGNEALQASYETYLANLREEVAFNHRQSQKLDSLTSAYYYGAGMPLEVSGREGNNSVNFFGDRRVRLFLDKIYEQQKHTQLGDYRLQLATAPVVLENHFAVDPKPVMSRAKCIILFFLLGWIGACLLAQIIDKRKAIAEWLKQ